MTTARILYGGEDSNDVSCNSLGKLIIKKLEEHRDEVCLIEAYSEKKLTFNELMKNAIKLCIALKKIGLEKDDIIAIMCENCIECCIIFIACLCNGMVLHWLNPEHTKFELDNLLPKTKPKLIFGSEYALKLMTDFKDDYRFIQYFISIGKSDQNIHMSLEMLLNLAEFRENYYLDDFDIKEKLGCILNSSGSTGFPKPIGLTHNNIKRIISYIGIKYMNYTEKDVSICCVPLNHIFGIMILMFSLMSGSKLIIMKKFKPEIYLGMIQKYKVTKLVLVPPLVLFLIKNPIVNEYDLSSLKCTYSGGANLKHEIAKLFEMRLNVKLHFMYGLTETSGCVTYNNMEAEKFNSIGKLIPQMYAKVIDEEGNSLGPGEYGEMLFKGPNIMKMYINNEEATKRTIESDGFLHSGDIGYYDEDGYFYIVDRIKDIIKYKAFSVSPSEIEALLLSHPGIKDAAVAGKPDDSAGELSIALIVKKSEVELSEEEIIKFAKDHLSPQSRLYGGVKFVEEIPKNAYGKIDRRKLKDLIL